MKNKNIIFIILVLIFGILASRTLFKENYYFNMHDDLQMMRQLQMEKCFQDKQLPCRWVPDMGYGYGFPLFNYYPPLPYLVGEVFRAVGFSFNTAVKLMFALGIIASGLAMFMLVREFFGNWGGLLSSVFYIWAPYRAVDVYVRGAMNESWAWVWFPLIFWMAYKLITEKKNFTKWIIGLALSWTGLLLSHNIMVLIFTPVFAGWCLLWIWRSRNLISSIKYLVSSGLLALGLTAFFTLPAIFEQGLVNINTLVSDYYEYFAHFVSFKQLFISRFWGDGSSAFGVDDKMAFPVGQVHSIVVLLIVMLLVIKFLRKKKGQYLDFVVIFGIVVGTFSAFMAHTRSIFIWLLIPSLKFVQFPWRFLTLTVLGFSFAIGSLFYLVDSIKVIKKGGKAIVIAGLSIILLVFNWNYFKPVRSGPLTDSEKFSGEAWRIQQQAGIRDYLPVGAKEDPRSQRKALAEIMTGTGEIVGEESGTNWAKFKLNISHEPSVIRVNIFDFPNWRVYVDGKVVEKFISKDERWGRMYLEVPQGEHQVYLKLYNTPLRTVANIISLISWLGLIIFLLRKKITSWLIGAKCFLLTRRS